MSLAGKHIVVSAGGTREPIDPVRYIGNRSSGKMGFALADAAKDRGAAVTLVTTVNPPNLKKYTNIIMVETVAEMRKAVLESCRTADVLIMAAAVSDFRMANPAVNKIKKKGSKLILELVQTEDFLLELTDNFVKVGFAAETEDLMNNAEKKLRQKRLDFICANDVSAPDAGFAVDTNRVTMLFKDGRREELPLMSKREVAEKILDSVENLLDIRGVV
jgi:phosphopantothenoylcysteine decarboxylase / phosphopantothenate---cysteine ligase